ncbi:translocation/assembly module TamB domain-containing protein [Frateuria terrea]|uniref:Autotransporter secretion inner membrane protein TamB n=1 Tax=Frateuria terrea TaxID=529704 RepID=A0A1H6YU03_9GAMM|nr:translocation/assembly module TamB domain-containing protein [Frateuria terrea]SEJ40742.1 autotransporter secretion inner membrane protein TamB [Frateuria terrea]SFP74800.1 autotransporter secretion inner membrane protein TamB [Frateuria terrea]
MKWLRRIGVALLAVLVLLALGLWWLLDSNAGLRFALARASGFTNGALSVQRASGSLAGPLELENLRYADGKGLDVRVARAKLDLRLWPLLGKRLHVDTLDVQGVDVALPPPAPSEQRNGPLSLKPPLAIQLDQAHVGDLVIHQNGQPLFTANSLDLAGRWDAQGMAIRALRLRSPQGRVDADGTVAIGNAYRGDGHASFAWKLGDTTYAGQLQARSDGSHARLDLAFGQPMTAKLHLALQQGDAWPWSATLAAPRFDPAPLLGEGTLRSLALDLKGSGNRHGGTLTGNVDLNDWRLQLAPLRAQLSDDRSLLTLQTLTLTSPQIKGRLEAQGKVRLDTRPIAGNLHLAWQDLALPAELGGQALASHGDLDVHGSTARFHAEGSIAIGPPGKLAQLAVNLDGTPRRLALQTLDIRQPQGHLHAQGTLTLQPAFGWELAAEADDFDPGQLLAGWTGALDAQLQTRGSLPSGHPDATLDLARLDGRLRGRAIKGHGKLHLAPNQVLDGTLSLASGGSHVSVQARPGARNDVQVQLAIATLADWLPDAGGQLEAHIHVTGRPPALGVDGDVHGRTLAYGTQRVGRLDLKAHVPDIGRPSGNVELDARDAWLGGLAFDTLTLHAGGTEAAHQLKLDANGRQLSASLALHGGLKQAHWHGTLDKLELEPRGLPRWRLQAPATLDYDQGTLALSELCLTAGDPLLCVQGKQDKAGNLAASYRLRALPLALLLNAAGYADLPLRADGSLHGEGTLKRNAGGALSGRASLASDQGSITYTQQAQRPLLAWRDLAVDADLAPGRQQVEAHAALNANGRLDGRITMDGDAHALGGELTLKLDSLAPLELLTSEVANVKGRLDGRFGFAGTLAQPAVTGQATVDGFAAEAPALGLKLTDGALVLRAPDAQHLELDGHVRSGKGTLAIGGSYGLTAQAPSAITLTGKNVTVADIPAAKVALTPDLRVQRDAQGVLVTGAVALDSADVNLDRLPGGGATKASPDVVVVDEREQEQAGARLPISARVKVDLGSRTHLAGKGLDGRLTGTLTVIEQPGSATRGEGQIGVSGTYKAYGQDLNIEAGKLLFAGTPIDNPGLNIRAARSLNPNATIDEGQEVGLLITGTAQRPILTVFSNPPMEQSDALSYLITGKPLSQVSGGEGNMVGAAAQALGSAAGDLLAKSIGSRLGIDEIGVSSNEALGGESAFTVGKYLSPRLYLSYGVGLFEPGQVITLRYRLSQRWNLEVQNATEFSRASLNYRLER